MSNRPLRIVYFIDTLGLGGTELNAVRLAEHLDPEEFAISVACFGDGPLRARLEAANIPIHRYTLRSLYGPGMVREGRRFAAFLKSERVDVVHSHDRYSNLFCMMWGRYAGTPGLLASKRWGTQRITHTVTNRLAYRLAHRVLGNSEQVGKSLVAVERVARERVVVVPNFVDDDAFHAASPEVLGGLRRDLDVPADALVVGIVARLSPIKDHRSLIKAVALLAPDFPKLVLVLIGSGPNRAELEAFAAAEGVTSIVRFAGQREPPPNLHSLFDVSVLCSLSEGFPNSVVEAMAAGRPVVGTTVGGVPDAVRNGENGILVPVQDPPALAAALAPLLRDSELRRRMGEAGRRIAREEFSASTVLPRLAALYRELATRTPH
ncbi:MAG: glycosyl transferase, group 1 [Gemmatimonadetes bacterium]|jgi:glycosyltransferase involved in cell wall biosynthesis|nr:glycosyl transferase, group 1 [Gemmatimonadota bacterium]